MFFSLNFLIDTKRRFRLQLIRHSIKNNTVDKLKHILAGFNDECGMHFSKSGKKQDIIDRITAALDNMRASDSEDRWTKAKAIVYQVRNNGA